MLANFFVVGKISNDSNEEKNKSDEKDKDNDKVHDVKVVKK